MVFQFLMISALFSSSAMAWKWGGLDEKLAAMGFLLATATSVLANQNHYEHTETGVLAIDILLFVALLVLALRSDRFWPMWAAAFQMVGTMVHIASMTETGDFAWAYAVGLVFWSYPVVIALMVGTWLEARQRQWQ